MDKLQLSKIIVFLSEVPFFSEVSEKSLMHLSEGLQITDFRKNATIFNKDDSGDSMFVILKGKVKVHENLHVFDHLSEKDCFGEYALIDNKVRSASVTAVESTQVLEIKRDHFLKLMATDSGFSQGILSVMIKRHRELDRIQERLSVSKNELELAHDQLSALIKGAMDAIIMFDTKFRILLTNPSAEKLFESTDVLQRNVLFFLDEEGASVIEKIVTENKNNTINSFLPSPITVIGTNEKSVITEGTISKHGKESEVFYTLILRNIEDRLQDAATINLLTSQTYYLKEEIKELTNTHGIIAEDESMKSVLKAISQVAKTDATVLITGETGTGKELVAHAIHNASLRHEQPLIRINCGAIPANLIESELFGHEKGAFTGATASRKGRFLLAHKGTIFLDEIGELPIDLQPKLLRVIQEGEFDPVGSSETIKVDVRIIAATHRDLLTHAAEGKFREDLYYRLNVFPIDVPALRKRGNDICLIAQAMMDRIAKKLSKQIHPLSNEDQTILLKYNWPGNVRELQNLIERAVIIARDGEIQWNQVIPSKNNTSESLGLVETTEYEILTSDQLLEFEKANIIKALKKTHWKISGANGAANLLQMAPTTLASKLKALGITRPV